MPSDLSQSLIDAAAEASYLAWHHGIPFEDQAPDVRDEYFRGGRAAVVAVLETLAAESGPLTLLTYERRSLRRLAAEIRGGDV